MSAHSRPPIRSYNKGGIIVLPQAEVAEMRCRRDVDGLCRTLEHADRLTATYAAEFLADIGGPTATDALLRCLRNPDEDPVIIHVVIQCLGQLRERRAVPDLIAALRSRDQRGWIGDEAVRALGEIGDPRAVQPLVDMLISYTSLGSEVLDALTRIGDARAVPGLLAALWFMLPRPDDDSRDDLGTEAVRTLGWFADPRAAPALAFLVGMSAMPSALRRAAAEALRQTDVTSVAGYGCFTYADAALGDPDQRISEAIAEMLSTTRPGLYTLRHSVTHPDPAVRRSACFGLGAQEDAQDVPALRTRLSEDADVAVRRAAAHALARTGCEEAMTALVGALSDGAIHEDVAYALAAVHPPPTDQLLTLLADGTNQQRLGAATALGLLGERRAAPGLLVLLTDATALPVRVAAVDALGRLRHLPAAPPLIGLLTDPEAPGRLRARAAWALGRMGATEAEPVLRQALSEPVESIRLRAAEALGLLPGSPPTVASLAQAAQDPSPDVQEAALQALGNLGSLARPALRTLLATTEGRLRPRVVTLLARCADITDLDTLTAIAIEDETQAALHAVDGIARLRDPRTVDALCRIIDRPEKPGFQLDFALRTTALRGLCRIQVAGRPDPSAAAALMACYMGEAGYRSHEAAREAVNTLADRMRSA
ncbi:HEAT repeat domain-containing protein [Streptomyces broussonetiae]|uniref:HEAT repeat domain-containing protein n=1 Tax=Streptomyces broussonetiae TaxID=2686304 RepID=UPI0035E11310